MTTALILGRQTFDGLGRQLTVESGPRITQYHYQPGQLPPAANTLADGSRVEFTYEPQLDNQLLTTTVPGQPPQRISYDPRLSLPATTVGNLGQLQWTYTASGKPKTDTWRVGDEQHVTRWRHSLNGLLLDFKDSAGALHQRDYDALGRVAQLTVGTCQTAFIYDDFSRPSVVTTYDTDSGKRMVKTLQYDALGREHVRTFETTENNVTRTVVHELQYCAMDRVISRVWTEGEQRGEEHYAYDWRGRLIDYRANDVAAPTDPFGNRIVRQAFRFNALDGYEQVVSEFADGSNDKAVFQYADDDPTQVREITHTHASWPARISLRYDACGRMIEDSLGRTLAWDAEGRLTQVSRNGVSCEYRYDPSGHLTDRVINGELTRSFYSADQLTHERRAEDVCTVVGDGGSLFALTKISAAVRSTVLLGTDAQGSVRLQDHEPLRTYTAHGAEFEPDSTQPFGFAGERRDEFTGWYIPGGYRPYDPLLMCFLAPDDESPFGRGGLNPYAYCGGDPVNRVDPDGHSWTSYVLAGIGIAIGISAMISTFGAAAPSVAALFTVGLSSLSLGGAMAIGTAAFSVVSMGTGIAASVLEAAGNSEKAAGILGAISMGTGFASMAMGMAPAVVGRLRALAAGRVGRAASALGEPANVTAKRIEYGNHYYFERAKGSADVAFFKGIWDKQAPAFRTHGAITGQLMNQHGVASSAARVARELILPRLKEIGYEDGKKLILISCWAGRTGAAQTVANVLNRPVQAYMPKIYVAGAGAMQQPPRVMKSGRFGATNVPLYKIALWKRIFQGRRGPFFDAPHMDVAKPVMFYPV